MKKRGKASAEADGGLGPRITAALERLAPPPIPANSCRSCARAPRVPRIGWSRVSRVQVWKSDDFVDVPAAVRTLGNLRTWARVGMSKVSERNVINRY